MPIYCLMSVPVAHSILVRLAKHASRRIIIQILLLLYNGIESTIQLQTH